MLRPCFGELTVDRPNERLPGSIAHPARFEELLQYPQEILRRKLCARTKSHDLRFE